MTNWALWGTLVNTFAVLFGAFLGLAIKAIASRLSKTGKEDEPLLQEGEKSSASRFAELPSTVQKGLGLCVLLIGILGAVKVQNMLIMIVSVVLGAIVGELLDLDRQINRLGAFIEGKMKGKGGNVAQGFVTATLLFCVGAMTVTGAMESGILRVHSTYYAKSMLDMVSAVIFASSLGIGVAFSAVGVFAVQGLLTLAAVLAAGTIPVAITGEMIAVGSLLVIGIGTNLLGITKLKVMNYVPAMFFPIGLCPLYEILFV
ncbi:MAG: DUF554 domain-containing protein [Clostridia bacterium]|nr:DUF554 domain-containing protein [Clostridia bacterium]